MTTAEFILLCIGAYPDACRKIDEIEDKFILGGQGFAMSESDIDDAIRLTPKNVGNYLISMYYKREIDFLVERYRDDGITEDLFGTEINSSASALFFDGQEYYDEPSIMDAIESYINGHKEEQS